MVAKFKRFKKGRPWEATFFSIFLGLLFLAVIGLLIYSSWKITQRRAELTSGIEALKKEIQVLEEKNAKLRAGLEKTKSEDYQKEKLYEQGYIEKGAQQVVVLPPKEEEFKETEERGFWNPQNWWEWIKEKLRD